MSKLKPISSIFVLSIFAQHVISVNIQFYRTSNFTDIFYESNSTAKCNNIPREMRHTRIKSIKTDTCLLVYRWPNCQAVSRKFDPNNRFGWDQQLASFHICNEEIGGPQLNVDLTKWYDLDYKPADIPDVLESHQNVCSCINIPKYVRNMTKWSINNYGNDLLAYYEPNCLESRWKSDFVPGGHWQSAHPFIYYVKINSTTKIKYTIQSLGPDPTAKYFDISCNRAATTPIVPDEIKETKRNTTLENLLLLMHIHDLETIKKLRKLEVDTTLKFANIEQDERNFSARLSDSETKLRGMEVKMQKEHEEFQNLTEQIHNEFNEILAKLKYKY